MEIKIDKVRLENYKQYKECEFSLDDQGLVFLEGHHSDQDYCVSNGAGKSNLLGSITWILWEKSLAEAKDKLSVISYDNRYCSGSMSGTFDGSPFEIKRTRTTKGIEIKTTFSGSSREKDIQQEINQLFGTYNAAQNTVFLGQQKALEFMISSDAPRKQLLEDLLKLNKYNTALDKIKEDRKYLLEKKQELKQDIDKWTWELEKQVLEISHQQSLIRQELEIKLKLAQEEKESSEIKLEEVRKLERKQLNHLRDMIIPQVTKTSAEWNEINYERTVVRRDLENNTNNQKCPTCGAERDPVFREFTLHELKEKLLELDHAYLLKTNALGYIKTVQEDALKLLGQHQAEKSRLEKVLTDSLDQIVECEHFLSFEEIESNKIPELVTIQRHINKQKSLVDSIDESLYVIGFWEEGFGHKGIPSLLIEQSLPVLNININEILLELTDGRFKLQLAAIDTTNSNKIIDRLSFLLMDFGRSISMDDCSAGEKRRIVISIFLALSRLQYAITGVSWNFRFIDELFDSLDEIGVTRVMHIMQRLVQKEIPTIIIASHRSELKNLSVFDQTWVVKRKDQYSTLCRL